MKRLLILSVLALGACSAAPSPTTAPPTLALATLAPTPSPSCVPNVTQAGCRYVPLLPTLRPTQMLIATPDPNAICSNTGNPPPCPTVGPDTTDTPTSSYGPTALGDCTISGIDVELTTQDVCTETAQATSGTPSWKFTTYPATKPKTLLNKSSSNSHILTFTVPAAYDGAEIDMHYSYHCSGGCNFIVNSRNNAYPDPFDVNELDSSGSGVSVDNSESAGTKISVQVLSEGSWHVWFVAIPALP